MLRRGLIALVGIVMLVGSADGQPATTVKPQVIRIGTIAPDGSSWARELKSFAKDIATRSGGAIRIKLIMSGSAGDELEMSNWISKDKLDGVASGGGMCQIAAPSIRVLRLFGVFQNRDESNYVLRALQPLLVKEANANGYGLLGVTGLGADVILSRRPLATLKDIKATRLWRWVHDPVGNEIAKAMDWNVVLLPVWDAAPAYDKGQVDGFIGILGAALAFQWYAQAKFLTPLPTSFLAGCMVIANRAIDPLPPAAQEVLRTASAKLIARIQTVGAEMDDSLLKVFKKRGIKIMQVSNGLRAEFFEAARAAREKLGEKLVSRAILDRTLQLLADYRAEHR